MREGLASLDWIVIAAYGAAMLMLGVYYVRRQHSADDFFVGGRSLNATAVGISLLATLLSTISYLATPGEIIGKGPIIILGMAAAPLTYLVIGYGLIPIIMRYKVTSAYEVLEARLGVGPRMLAVVMFLALRLIWMGVMIKVSAEAVVGILGLNEEQVKWAVPVAILVCGIVAVIYTALGGLRAVVTTDVIQFILMAGGAVLTVVMVTWKMKGFDWWPTQWHQHWETQPMFSFDPHVRVTVFGTILGSCLWWICTAGSDQTAIQRFMATGSTRAARRSFLVNIIADTALTLLLGLVGLALLAFYAAHSEAAGGGVDLVAQADRAFPRFIATQLPAGIAGLIVAAMFAAVMSSLDSGLNATASVIITDFIRRFRGPARNSADDLRLARRLTVAVGIAIVLMAMVVTKVEGNILEMSQKTVGLFVAPLFGLFFVAFFVRFGSPFGAMVGAWYSCTTAFLIAFWDAITGQSTLSFQWIIPCSLAVSIVTGVFLSLMPGKSSSRSTRLLLGALTTLPVAACNVWIAWNLLRHIV